MRRALLLALVGGALAATDPPPPTTQTKLDDVPAYTSTIGKFSVTTLPGSGTDAFPFSVFTAFDLSFNGKDSTDLFIDGKDVLPMYKARVADLFGHGDATVLFPVAPQQARPLQPTQDYSAFLGELWFGKDTDCDAGKECVKLHGKAVDIMSSRCTGGEETGEQYPCWTYPNTTYCTPYDTSDPSPTCGHNVTIEYNSQGVFTVSNGTTHKDINCFDGQFFVDNVNGRVSYNASYIKELIAANTVDNTTTSSFIVLHVNVKAQSLSDEHSAYVTVYTLLIYVDPDTGLLDFRDFGLAAPTHVQNAAYTTQWDGDTYRLEMNVYAVSGVSQLDWRSFITPFSSYAFVDFRVAVSIDGGDELCVASQTTAKTFPSGCVSLLSAGSVSYGGSVQGKAQVFMAFDRADVDAFFVTNQAVEGLRCPVDFLTFPITDSALAGTDVYRWVNIDPPVVPVCEVPDNTFVSFYNLNLTTVMYNEPYDSFVGAKYVTALVPNANSSLGLSLTISTEWKGVGYRANVTSEIMLNEDIRCMVGLLNGTMLSDVIGSVGDNPYDDNTLDVCVNQTQWDVTLGAVLPNITVTCDICSLTAYRVDPLAFMYDVPSCNYKPCQNSVLHYFDVVTLDAAKACAVWNETDFTGPLVMTIEMVGGDADGNTVTKDFSIPIETDCVADLGCDGLGYSTCTGVRRRGLWDDIVNQLKEVVHDTVDDILDTKKFAAPEDRRRHIASGIAARIWSNLFYSWVYVSGDIVSSGITPEQVAYMRTLPLTSWLAYLQGEFPEVPDAVLQNVIDNLKPRSNGGIDVPIVPSQPTTLATFSTPLVISSLSLLTVTFSNIFMAFGSGVAGVAAPPVFIAGHL